MAEHKETEELPLLIEGYKKEILGVETKRISVDKRSEFVRGF